MLQTLKLQLRLVEAQNKIDLIKSPIDPGDGIITNEGVTLVDYNRTDRNEPAAPQLDPIALRRMENFLNQLKESIVLSDDEEDVKPKIEPIPEASYTAPEIVRPDLQTLLNQDSQNGETLTEIKNVRDQIKTEIGGIIKIEDEFDGDFDDTEFNPPVLIPQIGLSSDD